MIDSKSRGNVKALYIRTLDVSDGKLRFDGQCNNRHSRSASLCCGSRCLAPGSMASQAEIAIYPSSPASELPLLHYSDPCPFQCSLDPRSSELEPVGGQF